MDFSDLGINADIIRSLEENRIFSPTEIQAQAIPHILQHNQDLVAVAQTGTGKTAAFSLPFLQSIDPAQGNIQALILVPTRELGQQVAREFFVFSKYISPRLFAEAVYGGVPIEDQMQKLKRPTHVLVATPGRLNDLLERKALNLDNLQYLVLDEADEMISMGFKDEIDRILQSCKSTHQTMLFTATMPADIKKLISEYLHNPKEIRINATEFVNQQIEHNYLVYKQDQKIDYLKAFLSERENQRGIMFCRTKVAAKRLSKQLAGFTVTADALHGNLNQEMRDKVMRGFRKGRINLLVATDIAARGIDVKELDYVIHYHMPEKSEQYTHRSGRTARAGKSGVSVCMIKENELDEIKQLESDLRIKFTELHTTLLPETGPSGTATVFMNMGFSQSFNKDNIIDFLVEEAGLHHADIKNVIVHDNRSQFEIPLKYWQQVYLNLKNMKIAHRNLKLNLDEGNSRRNIY